MCTRTVVAVFTHFVRGLRKVLGKPLAIAFQVMTRSLSEPNSPKHTLPSTKDSTTETKDGEDTKITLTRQKVSDLDHFAS
jgi:hypothetical protein